MPSKSGRRPAANPAPQLLRGYAQQSVPALPLVPWASCEAVGWPRICRCASSDDVAVSPAALLIAPVGGCCSLRPGAMPVVAVWALAPGAGPEPASLYAVLHGPACAAPVLMRSIAAQLISKKCLVVMAGASWNGRKLRRRIIGSYCSLWRLQA